MAVPVITQPATPRIVAKGIAIPTLSISASESPTSYAASPLPAGLAINTSTGQITGTPTAAGDTATSVTATNGSGTSAAKTIRWTVMDTAAGAGAWNDVELDLDFVTRQVTRPGIEPPEEGAPLMSIGKGDRVNLLVGLKKWGTLQDIKPGSEVISTKCSVKEFEPDRQIELAGGTPTKVGSGSTTRFRIELYLDPADWSLLADYEGDEKTSVICPAEIEIEAPVTVYTDTETVTEIPLEGNLASPIVETIVFTGLSATEGAGYTLTLALTVASRPSQSCDLQRTMTLTYTGGVWVISDLAGPTSDQGAVDGTNWRVTMENTDITGDSNSVDVEVSFTTTADAAQPYYKWEITPPGLGGNLMDEEVSMSVSGEYLGLYDAVSGTLIGSDSAVGLAFPSPSAYFAAFAAAWDGIVGASEVSQITAISSGVFEIVVAGGTSVRAVDYRIDTDPVAYESPSATPDLVGTPRDGTLVATLTQDPGDPYRVTSMPYLVEVFRDQVAD